MTANEDWLSECRSLILDCAEPGTCYRLTCLGLGSLSGLRNARIQLVFLQLVLQNVLKVAGDCVTIFDPIFTPSDATYLKDCAGYVVLSDKPENYAVDANTVIYMPHCDLSLFETFLRDNWTPGVISNIILVGNNLSDYADNYQQFIPVSRSLFLISTVVRFRGPIHFTRPLPVSPFKESGTRPLYQNVTLIFGAFKVEAMMTMIRQEQAIPRYRRAYGAILKRGTRLGRWKGKTRKAVRKL